MSLPRELSLIPTLRGIRLSQVPAAELALLHGARVTSRLGEGEQTQIDVDSHCLDMELAFDGGEAPAQGEVALFRTGDRLCRVGYDGSEIYVERGQSGCVDYKATFKTRLTWLLPWIGEGFTLRIVADQSTLEVFGPEGCAITCEIYPPAGAHLPVEWAMCRGTAEVKIWSMDI